MADAMPGSARSALIAPQQHYIVRLVRGNRLKCGLNRFGQGFQLEWLLQQGLIAQIVPKARQIRITTDEGAAGGLPKGPEGSAAVELGATVAKATAPPSNGKSWRRDRVSDSMVFIPFSPP
jgi:hypothetical protein